MKKIWPDIMKLRMFNVINKVGTATIRILVMKDCSRNRTIRKLIVSTLICRDHIQIRTSNNSNQEMCKLYQLRQPQNPKIVTVPTRQFKIRYRNLYQTRPSLPNQTPHLWKNKNLKNLNLANPPPTPTISTFNNINNQQTRNWINRNSYKQSVFSNNKTIWVRPSLINKPI